MEKIMMTEKEKMLSSELYFAAGPELTAEHLHAQDLTERLNMIPLREEKQWRQWLVELLGSVGENVVVKSPFCCDYGYNIHLGDRCVVGAGSVVTKDIPDDSLAVGNPAKVIRKLCEQIKSKMRLR
jgi:maltose O-acetyltransferase